jgi:hypothetical protein
MNPITKASSRPRKATVGALIALTLLSVHCAKSLPDVYVPVGSLTTISADGTLFGLREGEVPLAESAASLDLYMTARGVRDIPAVQAMVGDGRIIFLPVGSRVEVLEHDRRNVATKVRVREGVYIGREVWTHPKFVTPVG